MNGVLSAREGGERRHRPVTECAALGPPGPTFLQGHFMPAPAVTPEVGTTPPPAWPKGCRDGACWKGALPLHLPCQPVGALGLHAHSRCTPTPSLHPCTRCLGGTHPHAPVSLCPHRARRPRGQTHPHAVDPALLRHASLQRDTKHSFSSGSPGGAGAGSCGPHCRRPGVGPLTGAHTPPQTACGTGAAGWPGAAGQPRWDTVLKERAGSGPGPSAPTSCPTPPHVASASTDSPQHQSRPKPSRGQASG